MKENREDRSSREENSESKGERRKETRGTSNKWVSILIICITAFAIFAIIYAGIGGHGKWDNTPDPGPTGTMPENTTYKGAGGGTFTSKVPIPMLDAYFSSTAGDLARIYSELQTCVKTKKDYWFKQVNFNKYLWSDVPPYYTYMPGPFIRKQALNGAGFVLYSGHINPNYDLGGYPCCELIPMQLELVKMIILYIPQYDVSSVKTRKDWKSLAAGDRQKTGAVMTWRLTMNAPKGCYVAPHNCESPSGKVMDITMGLWDLDVGTMPFNAERRLSKIALAYCSAAMDMARNGQIWHHASYVTGSSNEAKNFINGAPATSVGLSKYKRSFGNLTECLFGEPIWSVFDPVQSSMIYDETDVLGYIAGALPLSSFTYDNSDDIGSDDEKTIDYDKTTDLDANKYATEIYRRLTNWRLIFNPGAKFLITPGPMFNNFFKTIYFDLLMTKEVANPFPRPAGSPSSSWTDIAPVKWDQAWPLFKTFHSNDTTYTYYDFIKSGGDWALECPWTRISWGKQLISGEMLIPIVKGKLNGEPGSAKYSETQWIRDKRGDVHYVGDNVYEKPYRDNFIVSGSGASAKLEPKEELYTKDSESVSNQVPFLLQPIQAKTSN